MKKYVTTLILIVIVLGFIFYWFQIRIAQAKKECSVYLTVGPNMYNQCLAEKGI